MGQKVKNNSRINSFVQGFFSNCYALRLLYKIISISALAAGAFFIAQKIYLEYNAISLSSIRLDAAKVLASWLCVVGATLLGAWEWTLLVKVLGGRLDPITGMRIHLISGFSKYVPGFVWPYLGKAHLAIRYGIPVHIAISSVIGEVLIIYLSGILLLLASLPLGEVIRIARTKAALVAGCVVFPFLLHGHLNKFLKSAGRVKRIGLVVIMVSLTWCLLGLGFCILDASLEPPVRNPWKLLAALISSLLGGQLVLFAPMGIGVREAILVLFLSLDKPTWLVVSMTMIFRLEMTLGEVFATLLVLLLDRMKRRRYNPKR